MSPIHNTRPFPFFRRMAPVALVMASLFLSGCDRLGLKSPAERIVSARKELAARNPKAAEIQLKTALQKEPKNVEARLLLADVYLALHRGPDAEVELGQAEQFGADPAITLLPRARAFILQRNYNRVLRDVPATVTGTNDRQADLLEVRGEAQMAMGLVKDAEGSFEAALHLRPQSLAAINGKARSLAGQNRTDEALTLVDSSLAIAPDNTRSLALKGDILQAMDRRDEAIQLYQTAVKGAPDEEATRVTLASALIAAKRLDEAKEQVDLIIKRWPNDPQGQYLLATMRYNRGEYQAAFEAVQKVTSADPNYAPAIALTGSIQYALGSYVAAEANATRFVAAFPLSIYGRKLLAAILMREGKAAATYDVLKPMLTPGGPQDPQIFALAGSALAGLGDAAKAHDYLARAVALDPGNQSLRDTYGTESLATGDVDTATASFKALYAGDPGNGEAAAMLVMSYVGKKDFATAMTLAQRLVDEHPKDAIFQNLLGGVQLAKEDLPAARASFARSIALRPDWSPPTINLAKLDLRTGQNDDARGALSAFDEHGGKDPAVLLMLANVEIRRGRFDEAHKWLARAAKENPDSTPIQAQFVEYLTTHQGELEAVGVARALADRRPNDPEALALLGRAQAFANQRDAAVATYGRVAGLRPNDADPQLAIARLEAQDGHMSAAQAAISKALALAPDSPQVQVSAAQLAVRLGRDDDAAKLVAQLDKRPETAGTARLLAGDIAMGRHQTDVAIKAYQEAFAKLDNSIALIKLHAALAAVGRQAEANQKLLAWMARNPQNIDSRIYFAGLAEVRGDTASAKKYFTEALQIDPDNPIALNELAVIGATEKDPAALGFAEKAYARRPDSSAIGDTLGWLLVNNGKAARGKELLEKALAQAPTNLEIRYHLAFAQAKLGDKDAARTNLRVIVRNAEATTVKADAERLLGTLS